MAFDSYAVTSNDNSNSKKSNVDFEALNQYVIDTAECEQPETMNGYISFIVDLGTQKQPDAEYDLDEEDVGLTVEELTEKYKDLLAENFEGDEQNGKITKFGNSYDSKTKSWVLRKFVKQKERQSFVYAVDFPDVQLDKGQFFGDDSGETKPLRLWSGGQFYNPTQKKMIVQNMIPLKITKDDKLGWTMKPNSAPYKLAVGTKVITTEQPFTPQQLDELLGKTAQFQVQIFNREGTGDHKGKKFYTEKLKFVGAIQKKDKPFTDVETHLIQFNQSNDEESLKQVRKHILNTIMNATNYEGSAIQKQLEEARPHSVNDGGTKVAETNKQPTNASEDLDDDLPF